MSYIFSAGIDKNNILWEDIKFYLIGKNIDTSSGRIDYDYINGAVNFNSNARYPQEPISMLCQISHSWALESELRPHIHWIQQSANEPNWLLAYKKIENGAAFTIETDYTNHTLVKKDNNSFSYSTGNIVQITNFPAISMTGITQSSYMIHFVLFRDVANNSGIFAGAESDPINELALEFDVHFQQDSLGSRQEFVK